MCACRLSFSSGDGFFGILLCRFVKIIIFAAGIRSFEAGVEVPSQLVFGYLRLAWVHFAASVHQFVAGVRVCNVPLRKCLDLARRGRAECVPVV